MTRRRRHCLVFSIDGYFGIVKLGGKESFWFVIVACPGVASGRCDCPPDLEGSRSQEPVIRRSQQMAPNSKKILDDSLKGEKPLGLASRLESAHLPFPLAGRLMRGFGAIVGVTFRVMSYLAQDRSQRRQVAS